MLEKLTGEKLTAPPSRQPPPAAEDDDGNDIEGEETQPNPPAAAASPRSEAEALGKQLATAMALSRSMSGRKAGRAVLIQTEVSKLDRFLDTVRDQTTDSLAHVRGFFARNGEKIGIALMVAVALATVMVVVGQAITSSSSRQGAADEQTSAAAARAAQRQQGTKSKPRERTVIKIAPATDQPP